MTVESSLFHSDSEDIFAKAIERVEAGETIDAVLATVPEAMRPELRELLLLVTATHHLHRAPVPQSPAPRRAERKAAFLQAAAQMKAEEDLSTPVPPLARAAAPIAKPVATKPVLAEWLRDFWQNVQAGLSGPNLRLAPLVILVIAIWLGAFGFARVADAAGIGDIVYPVRQWIRYQNFSLSSEAVRGRLYNWLKDEILRDLINATYKLKAQEAADGRKGKLISTEFLVFEGIENGELLIGPLRVQMQYQPDPNVAEFVEMDFPVTPGKGTQVELTFQIIATDDETAELPFIVQGISLRVPEVQLAIGPTPTAETPTPPTETVIVTPCEAVQPDGWVPYVIRSGETLSLIAQRSGATLAQLQQVNCLPDANQIRVGDKLFAPMQQQVTLATATQQPPLAVTLTAISTTVLTPSVAFTATVAPTATVELTITATPTAAVTATATMTATTDITTTTGVTPTVVPTSTAVLTTTVTQTATVTPTPTPTVVMTVTVAGSDEVTATATPSATEVSTETVNPAGGTLVAPTATTLPTPEATPTAGATMTEESAEASPTPTAENTQEATVVDTPTPQIEPTSDVPATKEIAPTSIAKQSTSEAPPTAAPPPTATPAPPNQSPLTGG